ncbi:MAG: hypothetical protein HYZ26_07470 [Chloroflexi bacterium]|nr:hypothetical protein [Chloroflexota bacterium]
MTGAILLATLDGVWRAELTDDGWKAARRGLAGREVTSLIAREGVILAATRQGVLRSDDSGVSWQEASLGLKPPIVRWLAYHPDISDFEAAGTEPAGIYISTNGGDRWSDRPEVAALRDRHGWMLPYSPEAGCVRGMAFHGRRLYAAVEVGGVLRSDDGGKTFGLAPGSDGKPRFGRPKPGFVHPDVHDIKVHPSSADLVWAVTGGGLFRSQDGGTAWESLYDCYCRALWLDPQDPQHVVFGPAEDVGRMGRIERSRDGGQTWEAASSGLDVPWPDTMPERLAQVGETMFCNLDDGRLLAASIEALDWGYILPDLAVNAVAAAL